MKFYSHKKAALLAYAALCAASLYFIKDVRIQSQAHRMNEYYSIDFEYPGMDAQTIERMVALPLEERLSAVEGVLDMETSCMYSKCVTNLEVKSRPSLYMELSDIADGLYRTLPKDANRPHIYFSSSEERPIFCAALEGFSVDDQAALKGSLLSIEGVSQVEVLGRGVKEIQGAANTQRLSEKGLFLWSLSDSIQTENAPGIISNIEGRWQSKKVCIKNTFDSKEKINETPIFVKNNSIKLTPFLDIKMAERRPSSIVRINGKECPILLIKSSSKNSCSQITKRVRKILSEDFKNSPYKIIYDKGADEAGQIKKIFFALFQTAIATSLIVFILFKSKMVAASIAIFIATVMLFSIATLSALHVNLDRDALFGLTISIGLIADAALVVEEDFSIATIKSLFIATATSLAALVPLFFVSEIAPGIEGLSLTSALMIGLSFLIATIFVPFVRKKSPSCDWKSCDRISCDRPKAGCDRTTQSPRNILNLSIKSYIIPRKALNCYTKVHNFTQICIIFALFTPIIFFASGKNIGGQNEISRIIYGQVEYNPERSAESIDSEIAPFVKEKILAIDGVDFVRSEAKKGSAELEIGLKNQSQLKLKKTYKKIAALPQIANSPIATDSNQSQLKLTGSLYVPLLEKKRGSVQKIQIAICGPESKKCMALCREAGNILQSNNFFARRKAQVTLNFKEEEKVFIASPKKAFFFQSQKGGQDAPPLSFLTLSQFLRWNLFAPVADKIFLDKKTHDIRLGSPGSFSGSMELEKIRALSIPVKKEGSIPVNALVSIKEETTPSKIYRKGKNRAAYFTVEVQSKNTGAVLKKLNECLLTLPLEGDYFYILPKSVTGLKKNYGKIFGAFVFSLAFIFILISAWTENIFHSLKVLLTVPLCLLLPLLLRLVSGHPLGTGDAASLSFLSGLTVNNALYILGEFYVEKDMGAARKKVFKSILSSSLTTVIGCLPSLFTFVGGLASDLSFFMFFGTLSSIPVSLFVFPRLFSSGQKSKGLEGK